MMRKISRIILILVVLFIVCYGEYYILIKGPEYSKQMSGKVISSFMSSGRSTACFATILFDNGDIQEVNTGHYLYKIGDYFSNSLNWNPISGLSGLAYSWNPGDYNIFFIMPAVLFNICVVVSPVILLLWPAFRQKG